MKRMLIIFIALLISVTLSAQTTVHENGASTTASAQEVRISGTVVDKVSRARLTGVSITIPNTNISTVTNADGFFLLKLKSRTEIITVSSLGYKKQNVTLSPNRLNNLRISLTPATITLPDLNVWQNDPEALVKAAIEHTSDNFVQTRELHTSFYRETLQKGSRLIDVSEAILKTCKKGYDKGINLDRVKVVHGRHIVSQRIKDTISVKVQGGPITSVNYDAVKNTDILFTDIMEGCYSYARELPEELDGKSQIVISFTPKTVRNWPLYSGRIYLDRHTLAFTRIALSLDMSDKQKVTSMLLVKKPMGLRFKPQELTTIISYRDGRISYMRSTFRFKCDWRKRLFSRSYTSCSEMVVTDFLTNYEGPNIDNKERFSEKDILQNTIDDFSDKDFWKDYNIIEPTETLEKAIIKLQKK